MKKKDLYRNFSLLEYLKGDCINVKYFFWKLGEKTWHIIIKRIGKFCLRYEYLPSGDMKSSGCISKDRICPTEFQSK